MLIGMTTDLGPCYWHPGTQKEKWLIHDWRSARLHRTMQDLIYNLQFHALLTVAAITLHNRVPITDISGDSQRTTFSVPEGAYSSLDSPTVGNVHLSGRHPEVAFTMKRRSEMSQKLQKGVLLQLRRKYTDRAYLLKTP
jgi:hypothetical protein